MGTTMPTVDLSTPTCSILRIRFGKADSEEDVARISRYSRPKYLANLKMLNPVNSRRTSPKTPNTKMTQVM